MVEEINKETAIIEGDGDDDSGVDTATESYDSEDDSQYSYEDDNDGRPLPMPPLKYARIMGSLPRDNNNSNSNNTALSVRITSSCMGRVIVRPSQTLDGKNHDLPSGSKHGESGESTGTEWNDYEEEEADMSFTKVYHVLALGFEDGKVLLVDALTGGSVLFGSSSDDGGAWFVNPSSAKQQHHGGVLGRTIVALSFDSSSSYLSALNANGDAAIFGPLMWGRQSRRNPQSVTGEGNQKFGFLSPFGGKESQADGSKSNLSERHRILRPPFTLVKPPASTVRFTYADTQSFGSSILGGGSANQGHEFHPTCMSLDPAYGRRKERALIVGFDDGRLILSKLQGTAGLGSGITSLFGGGGKEGAGGGTSVKKVDSVLFQGVGATSFSGDQAGIEAVTWRGGLVAWADSSGVRLFDIESMSRIAHIDRPTGARSSLYPTISSLHPSLLFERSNSLLIGWGDCLMALLVRDSQSSKATSKDGGPAKDVKRKTVECTMAWELDCVACNAVPVDDKHVAVLGLVPSPSSSVDVDESDQNATQSNRDYSVAGGDNVLELQVINREDGKSISNDTLPLVEGPGRNKNNQRIHTANATEFHLLSSFACPRMDDGAEWEALDDAEKEVIRREVGSDSSNPKSIQSMPDWHSMWNMKRDICSAGHEIQSEASNFDDQSVNSDCSVCSDNYVFVLSEPLGDLMADSLLPAKSSPPIMTVLYSHDACLVEPRDADDVISYTRSLGKPALALKQALAHRREMRRHHLDQLVDEYLCALLRMSVRVKPRPLSFSRLKIAAESLPILLGGDPRMWQRWIFMISRIPGGLYVIREKIPVRDPELPAFVFEMAAEKMLEEALHEREQDESERELGTGEISASAVGDRMADLFLETIRSWGPTSALRRRIQLHRYLAQNQQWGLQWNPLASGGSITERIRQAERDLQRRISQTAFGVLGDALHSTASAQINSIRQHIDSSKDSLFDVEHLSARIAAKLQTNCTDGSEVNVDNDRSSLVLLGTIDKKSLVVIESLAELELMRERFDRALGYYLAIGSMSNSLISLEDSAVQIVNSHFQESTRFETGPSDDKFAHVLSMIELHQLSYILLQRHVFFTDERDDAVVESPIVSLIMLVGLARAGRFLIDNCSPPEGTPILDSDDGSIGEISVSVGSNLPIDLVAKQLQTRPKLLYWFLFKVFIHKPDMYVKFPTTAVPPASITDLHRIQFSLFVDHANRDGNGGSTKKESDSSPVALTADKDTPFMAFLRAALPLGGVQADTAREQLGKFRIGIFARELAFVIEKFGKGTLDDAKEVLQLYLRGANNLYMAVSFAERNRKHSSILWDILVEHCTTPDPSSNNQDGDLGALFGSLLEAAAHTGSDLASLVSRIPEGMSIEGLRPKLIAAISDYRHKVAIHEHVDVMLMNDKVSILRELSHLSRRGERVEDRRQGLKSVKTMGHVPTSSIGLLKAHRSKIPTHHRESHSFSLPMR